MKFKKGDYIVGGHKGNALGKIMKVTKTEYAVLWNNGNFCNWTKKEVKSLDKICKWRLAKGIEVTLYWQHPTPGIIDWDGNDPDLKLNP